MDISMLDAFDLPDWLGLVPVTWRAVDGLDTGALVVGRLDAAGGREQPLDLLAVDAAYPRVVCPDEPRLAAHQAWTFGEVTLFDVEGRATAGVPGTGFTADLACETVRRVARSVGASPGAFSVSVVL